MSVTGAESGPTIRITADTPDRPTVITAVEQVIDQHDVSIAPVGPTGAPLSLCLCTIDGTTAFHTAPTPETASELAKSLVDGELPTANAYAVVDHDPETRTVPLPDTGPLSVGTRRVLGRCGWVPPTDLPDPIADDVTPDQAVARIADAGLLGRGRADIACDRPIAELWNRTRNADGDPLVVLHAADCDAPADELLCRGAAGHVLDTAAFVAAVVGATDVLAFATEDACETLTAVTSEAQIVRAPESFLVGEPTMAIEALEGNDRIEARRRPPGPEEWGLYGRPTIIHTPRTLLQIRRLLAGELDADRVDPGTRILTIRGAVSAPATVEVRTDQSLATALEAVDSSGGRYAVGGRFGGLTETLDVPASAPALSAADLGTEGVIEILDAGRCVVASVGERAAFAREENCGRCVPCREGSKQLHTALQDIYDGTFDGDEIRTLARVMQTTSLCAFGEAASRPVRTAIEAFEPEFRAHADGRCPAGHCERAR